MKVWVSGLAPVQVPAYSYLLPACRSPGLLTSPWRCSSPRLCHTCAGTPETLHTLTRVRTQLTAANVYPTKPGARFCTEFALLSQVTCPEVRFAPGAQNGVKFGLVRPQLVLSSGVQGLRRPRGHQMEGPEQDCNRRLGQSKLHLSVLFRQRDVDVFPFVTITLKVASRGASAAV